MEASQPTQPQEQGQGNAPVATQQQDVIVAESGLGEQQPINSETGNPDQVAVNVSSPRAQSGVPLPEDRRAGMEANPEAAGMNAPEAPELPETPQQTPAEQPGPDQQA
jgi:hypothetical protein